MPGRSGCLDELAGEPLHPPVDRHVIDGDTAFGEQLLDVAVRQAVAQVPVDADRDDLPREAEACKRRTTRRPRHPLSLSVPAIEQRNSARPCNPRVYLLVT
jgi:hypothetical protein